MFYKPRGRHFCLSSPHLPAECGVCVACCSDVFCPFASRALHAARTRVQPGLGTEVGNGMNCWHPRKHGACGLRASQSPACQGPLKEEAPLWEPPKAKWVLPEGPLKAGTGRKASSCTFESCAFAPAFFSFFLFFLLVRTPQEGSQVP